MNVRHISVDQVRSHLVDHRKKLATNRLKPSAATYLRQSKIRAMRELLSINLESSGHRTMAAGSAEEAEQLIQTNLPDLILLDWMLPGRSGPQFATRFGITNIRQTPPRSSSLPALMGIDRVTGLEVGADGYIVKPFLSTRTDRSHRRRFCVAANRK